MLAFLAVRLGALVQCINNEQHFKLGALVYITPHCPIATNEVPQEIIAEREQANLVMQRARFFYISMDGRARPHTVYSSKSAISAKHSAVLPRSLIKRGSCTQSGHTPSPLIFHSVFLTHGFRAFPSTVSHTACNR